MRKWLGPLFLRVVRCAVCSFHFLGGIRFALGLITASLLIVAVGTAIESRTGSHLFAAQWTYGNPFFAPLLGLFFINIFFSALRRWPFKKKHLPFLTTHLGLLMVIGGTLVKNKMGVQGHLSLWEGSGSASLLLPQTYALSLEGQEHSLHPDEKSLLPLDSFRPNEYRPFSEVTCTLTGFSPHVGETLEAWIKGSAAYLVGFPPLPVHAWAPPSPLPALFFSRSKCWWLLALRTQHVQEATQQVYLRELLLRLEGKGMEGSVLDISLSEALQGPFTFANGMMTAFLELPRADQDPLFPSLHFVWRSEGDGREEKFHMELQGGDALYLKSDSIWQGEPFFNADLIRPHPILCLIEENPESTLLCAFDRHGRVHEELFDLSRKAPQMTPLRGAAGYGVGVVIPLPSFPAGREEKERASAYALELHLREVLSQNLSLSPPLAFLKQACRKAEVDLSEAVVEFLRAWHSEGRLLYHPSSLPPTLSRVLESLDWQAVHPEDREACHQVRHVLDSLESSALFTFKGRIAAEGECPDGTTDDEGIAGAIAEEPVAPDGRLVAGRKLTEKVNKAESSMRGGKPPREELEKWPWPMPQQLQRDLQSAESGSPFNLLAQQTAALLSHARGPILPPPQSLEEHASLLSAYFRIYGIDYRAFFPFEGGEQEDFGPLAAYWSARAPHSHGQQGFVVETPLTRRVMPEEFPGTAEEFRPGITLEVQEGNWKQPLALAYDASGEGPHWPILGGRYLIRFQPQMRTLPYRVRLRQARRIPYPESPQIYSYEADVLFTDEGGSSVAATLSMNRVYETKEGYRFYLSGIASSPDGTLKRVQIAVNHDPAKYVLTYPGAVFVFMGILALFWMRSVFNPSSGFVVRRFR